MKYEVEFTAYLTVEVEAESIEEARTKAYDNIDMRDFEIDHTDITIID